MICDFKDYLKTRITESSTTATGATATGLFTNLTSGDATSTSSISGTQTAKPTGGRMFSGIGGRFSSD